MSKRLQVLVDDAEYAAFQRAARRSGLALGQWARQALRAAWREQPSGDVARKRAAIRKAMRHEFPAPDMDVMLEEIEHGYFQGDVE